MTSRDLTCPPVTSHDIMCPRVPSCALACPRVTSRALACPQVLTSWLRYGLDPQAALDVPRVCLEPADRSTPTALQQDGARRKSGVVLYLEEDVDGKTAAQLAKWGHQARRARAAAPRRAAPRRSSQGIRAPRRSSQGIPWPRVTCRGRASPAVAARGRCATRSRGASASSSSAAAR